MPRPEDLTRYPRPNVAVDLALLTALPPARGERVGRLAVLMQPHASDTTGLVLPGRFLRERQTVVDAVADVLTEKVHLTVPATRPLLLRVYDDPRRDERAWTLSLAHALALPFEQLRDAQGELRAVDLAGRLRTRRRVLFDHAAIVCEAARALRERYERRPDPDRLLTEPCTLAELRTLHEAVLGEPLRRDTFNRRMTPHLEPLGDPTGSPSLRSSGGRPAQVFVPRRRPGLSASDRRRLLLPREDD